ncbi:hypothetical protein PPYR_08332 [Photinus pyralis]|uniref:Uncharacterized protein n=2 Tax=Photinus pyralis TaxID=7054 RepID=A0A5N4AJE9_PHOPY|nr:uncharacterized protein LOC116172267 [Photinus pyralis]KAB0797338.1 hypothetical protein PPYR_08332 [Photinus pyralis]
MFHISKFKIRGARNDQNNTLDITKIPFFPKYETKLIYQENLSITWFEIGFSQSKYSYEECQNGSHACTLIAVITAAKCHFGEVKIGLPQEHINEQLVLALAHGMLLGNSIHEDLKAKKTLSNYNLTIPQSLKYGKGHVRGLKEWFSELYAKTLQASLYENLKRQWQRWQQYCVSKNRSLKDLYVVLICDSRSVLFIFQSHSDTVSLIDSHRHSPTKGAFIATTSRVKLKLLCQWFGDAIYKYHNSFPQLYELSYLYFKDISNYLITY